MSLGKVDPQDQKRVNQETEKRRRNQHYKSLAAFVRFQPLLSHCPVQRSRRQCLLFYLFEVHRQTMRGHNTAPDERIRHSKRICVHRWLIFGVRCAVHHHLVAGSEETRDTD